MFRRVLPLLLVISLLTGCSLANKADRIVSDIEQNLKQRITVWQKPRPIDENEVKALSDKKVDVQVPKTTQPVKSPAKASTTQKKTTTKTTQPNPKTTQPTVTNNGRPSIPTKYSFEYLKAIEDEIVVLCNKERAKAGIGALVMNETLRLSARYKSNEMLQYNYFEHKSPITGFRAWDIARTYGYKFTNFGENLYMVQGLSKAKIEAANIVDAWMNSSGHRANILNGNFNKIGVGVVFSSSNNKCEATQHFSN